MQTIITATDFSPISLNAVNYAVDLCLATGNDLALFHAFPIPVAYNEWQEPGSRMAAVLSEAEEELNRLREKIISRTAEKIQVSTKLEIGEVMVQLQEYCETISPYAVVMGAENTHPFERFLLGAKTIKAMQDLSWPLIVVPPEVKFRDIRKIALACDFKNPDSIPLPGIERLVEKFHASLDILHVSNDDSDLFSMERVEESDLIHKLFANLDPQFHHFHRKEIEQAIMDFCETNNVDMLIVIPRRHDLFSKLLRHSVSRRLVLHAHFPVMAIHE